MYNGCGQKPKVSLVRTRVRACVGVCMCACVGMCMRDLYSNTRTAPAAAAAKVS